MLVPRSRPTSPRHRAVRLLALTAAAGIAAPHDSAAQPIDLPTVLVGNPGNSADPASPGGALGGVGYAFEIGVTEVTNTQYAGFLNAVAAADPYALYDTRMDTSFNGGLIRNGDIGSFSYTVRSGYESSPVIYISFARAARFANWMHNGQPIGPEGTATTESGAYRMTGPATMERGDLDGNGRRQGWLWAVPTQSEWHKAAYGNAGNAYTLYATASNARPTATVPPGPANSVNYFNVVGNVTPVGAYVASPSFWGTFDQNGNLAEWNEGTWNTVSQSFVRRLRGGTFVQTDSSFQASAPGNNGSDGTADYDCGFRLVKAVVSVQTGACCLGPGNCVTGLTQADCTAASGDYRGNGTLCSSVPCGIPVGACCLADGTCVASQNSVECATVHGRYHGDGSSCVAGSCNPIGTIVYVNAAAAPGGDGSSWSLAFRDLQDALDLSRAYPGTVLDIWIASGTYRPDRGTRSRAAVFDITGGEHLYGGFAGTETSPDQRDIAAHPTVLSGDLLGNDGPSFANNADNSYRVVRAVTANSGPRLDGLVISGGNANGGSGLDSGAGMQCQDNNAVLANCTFTGNNASGDGGGLGCTGQQLTVSACTFSGNRAGTGGALGHSGPGAPQFTDCVFASNSAGDGAAAHLTNSSPVAFTNTQFTNNSASGWGGAVLIDQGAHPAFTGSTFASNSASSRGGAIYITASTGDTTALALSDCSITGNTSQFGGAIYNANAPMTMTGGQLQNNRALSFNGGALYTAGGAATPVTLTGVSVTGNTAGDSGGALYFGGCAASMVSCTFAGNSAVGTGGSVHVQPPSVARFSSCTLSGGSAAAGRGIYSNAASVLGDAQLTGADDLVSTGTLSPGAGGPPVLPGAFVCSGGFRQTNVALPGSFSANLLLDVSGPAFGTECDGIDSAGGPLTLQGGGIAVTLANGFSPSAGQRFTVLRGGPVTGRFDYASMPGLANGLYLDVAYGAQDVTVSVAQLAGLLAFGPAVPDALGGTPSAIVLADMDLDGDPDAVLAIPDANPNNPGRVVVLPNLGRDAAGHWLGFGAAVANVQVDRQPAALVVATLNGDALPDVAVLSTQNQTVTTLFNGGNGTLVADTFYGFSLPTSLTTRPAASGAADLIVGCGGQNFRVQRLVNNGSGGFSGGQIITGTRRAYAVRCADLNGDGSPDLVVLRADTSGSTASTVEVRFYNQATGQFGSATSYTVGLLSRDALVADIDRDGRPDIVTVDSGSGALSAIINRSDSPGSFRPPVPVPVGSSPRSLTASDMNGDPAPELAFIVTDPQGVAGLRVLRNDTAAGGTLNLATASNLGGSSAPLLTAVSDVDLDGRPDLLVVDTQNFLVPGASLTARLNRGGPLCRADADGNGRIETADVAVFVTAWFASLSQGTLAGDFDRDGAVRSADVAAFVATWFAAVSLGC